jgi:hypothetical protein
MHRLPPLERLMLGHHEDHPISLDCGNHRQRDTGIAGGRFDQRVTGLDVAALFGFDNHR